MSYYNVALSTALSQTPRVHTIEQWSNGFLYFSLSNLPYKNVFFFWFLFVSIRRKAKPLWWEHSKVWIRCIRCEMHTQNKRRSQLKKATILHGFLFSFFIYGQQKPNRWPNRIYTMELLGGAETSSQNSLFILFVQKHHSSGDNPTNFSTLIHNSFAQRICKIRKLASLTRQFDSRAEALFWNDMSHFGTSTHYSYFVLLFDSFKIDEKTKPLRQQ